MKFVNGYFKLDVDEPIVELCSECEPPPGGVISSGAKDGTIKVSAGMGLLHTQANKLHRCNNHKKPRYWIFGMFLDTFATEGDLERWLNEMNHTYECERADHDH